MKKFLCALSFLFVVSIFSACSVQDGSLAENVAGDYYRTIQDKDFTKVITFYSPDFFTTTSKEDAVDALKGWDTELGDLQKFELLDWLVREQAGTERTGTVWVLRYKTTYSRFSAEEILTLFRPIGSSEIKIQGHHHQISPSK